MYSPVLLVMIVDDSLNYHAYRNTNFHAQPSTIMDHHVVWTSSNTFLNPRKGKFVKQSRASLADDHFLYSSDLVILMCDSG